MSFRSYLALDWEYLLAAVAMFTSSGCSVWAVSRGASGWAGLAFFCMLGFAYVAVTFADAADFRRLMAEASRRNAKAQIGEGA